MGSQVIDSALFCDQFGTLEMRRVFGDESLLQKWLDVEAALARAEARLGLIPAAAAEEISRQARAERLDMAEIKRLFDETGHPIVPVIRLLERACAGDAGQYIHWGATTQDIMDTATVLQLKDAYGLIHGDLWRLEGILLDLAAANRDVLIPGRTHGQHALPATFGYKVAVWAGEVRRHLERLEGCRDRVLVGQFGGAVGTLASVGQQGLEIQRLMMADLGLGVPDITWHVARDRLAELVSILAMVAATLHKIANEIATLQKTELAEVEEPFHWGKVGSSTMPHKRNPMICESICGLGHLVREIVPLALVAMVQEHERDMGPMVVEWEFVPRVCIYTHAMVVHSARVLAGLHLYPQRMAANVDMLGGLILSEAIMLELGRSIGRQRAHDVVYEATMAAYEARRPLAEVLAEDARIREHLTPAQIAKLLDPASYLGLAGTFVDRLVGAAQRARGMEQHPLL